MRTLHFWFFSDYFVPLQANCKQDGKKQETITAP